MAQTRRSFLRSLLGLLAAWAPGGAWPGAGSPLARAIAAETGGSRPAEDGRVSLEAPDIAEDGALVPVAVEAGLPQAEALWIFVEKNPEPLAARFQLTQDLDPFVSLRVKMNESCEVVAVVKAGGEYLSARKWVRVLKGGCG